MSDVTKTTDDQKPENSGQDALPKHQQLTFNQHLFIWTMVLVVGVLFGMGSTVSLLGGPKYQIGGIDQTEILTRQHVGRKLQDALNPQRIPAYYGGEQFEQSQQGYAETIQLARYAQKEGLLPDGVALDGIVKDFLAKQDRAGRSYYQILSDLGGERSINAVELRRFLAERYAVELLQETHVAPPVVPTVVASGVAQIRDQIEVDEVVIDARPVLPEIKPDDAAVQTTYEKLRGKQFRRPAARIVTVATVDQQKLSDAVTITDANLQAYYDAHKEQYKKPAPPVKEPQEPKAGAPKAEAPKAEYQALAEVSATIRETLRREQVEAKAKALVEAFDKTLLDQGVETMDAAAFTAAATKAGLVVSAGVVINEPEQGATLSVSGVGQLDENQIHLFAQDVNFVSPAVQAKDNGPYAVLHLDAKREAGFRDLTDPAVLKEVTSAVAGERAYKDFIAAMEILRTSAEKIGPGGLRKVLAAEAALKWDAAKKVTTATKPVLEDLRAPAAEFGGISADSRLLASLLIPARPVALVGEEATDGVPRVRLVQAVALKPAAAAPEDAQAQNVERYRRELERYRRILFQTELSSRLNR